MEVDLQLSAVISAAVAPWASTAPSTLIVPSTPSAPSSQSVPTSAPSATTLPSANSNDDDGDDDDNDAKHDDMDVGIACTNPVPHYRHDCTKKPFRTVSDDGWHSNFCMRGKSLFIPAWAMRGKEQNAEMCDLCHCYVCDKPAKECQRWSSTEHLTAYHNHCHATNVGCHLHEWKYHVKKTHKKRTLERQRYLELEADGIGRASITGEVIANKPAPEVANNAGNNDKDEEARKIKSCTNPKLLGHYRQNCIDNPFISLSNIWFNGKSCYIPPWATIGKDGNQAYCDLCYCYVCDKPAKDCQRWNSAEYSNGYYQHCHATEDGFLSHVWKEMRQVYKDNNSIGISRLEQQQQVENSDIPTMPAKLPAVIRVGAFSPTDQRASPFFSFLTECRRCGWYSYTGNLDANATLEDYPADWCQACGRIASNFISATRTQCQPYRPKPRDIYLGTKAIPFRIKAHDPRKMKKFQKNWVQREGSSPQWTYDEAEAEEDMFHHRLGTHPSLAMILGSIPTLREDKIPIDGVYDGWSISIVKSKLKAENECPLSYEIADDDDDEGNYNASPEVRAEDTDAILMDSNGITIFQELFKFNLVGVHPNENPKGSIGGDIVAKWNRDERRGEFVVRIFYSRNDSVVKTLGPLLGAWFGVGRFPLTAVGRNLKASSNLGDCSQSRLPFPLTKKEIDGLEESTKDEMNAAVDCYNAEIESSCAQLSLQSSFGSTSCLGGICPVDTSFSAFLQRYFAEILPDGFHWDAWDETKRLAAVTWVGRAVGVTSHHRDMGNTKRCSEFRTLSLESFVQEQDVPLAYMNLPEDLFDARTLTMKSINGILVHLENLGHGEAPFVEGLNVELLPFQRQTLQWALERETTPGGLQSFLSTKLPSLEEFYYHPVFESVSREKPKLVRGGIIADEMGLGKTVVSLALILQNPAPLKPESGTKSGTFTSDDSELEVGWDADWQLEKGQNPSKASIVSRGTLVVCHVSLVSQWIDEAKSKLNNAGLVYAYHGQSRKRDAMILARNAIIVTTYATLAKDATYHADKAFKNGKSDYCPPCEQIRWWRIICDESHTLKEQTAQTKAVMSLVGDHKWAVSGTPWNTSLMDIKNQLKFIGLEAVDQMFNQFKSSVFESLDEDSRRRFKANQKKEHTDDRKIGHFMFLMRAVMIRHSQKQQYRGTPTTLMSLPPKTERTIVIGFEPQEALEYASHEKKALDFYRAFAPRKKEIGRHYLKLIQALTPSRIACAGGRIPITEDTENQDKKKKAARGIKKDEAKPMQKKIQEFSKFRFQSKFNVLINELEKIRDDEPESKSLVFSQYSSSLKFLQEELPNHGFQYRTLTGDMTMRQRAEALDAFKHDPPTTVFLLSMRSGAVGINLTQANRVFLLEPAMNPSLAAQAIGRVYRLGQTRPVEIVRLLMKDSIETRISQWMDQKYSNAVAEMTKVENNVAPTMPATPSDVVASAPIIGSVRTEKATIMAAEFDFLFGLTSLLDLNPVARFHATVAMNMPKDEEEETVGHDSTEDSHHKMNVKQEACPMEDNTVEQHLVKVKEEANNEKESLETACVPDDVPSKP